MYKEEAALMKLELKDDKKSLGKNEVLGIKLNFFRLIYVLLQNQTDNVFRDLFFIVIEFIQLMSFPLYKVSSPFLTENIFPSRSPPISKFPTIKS
mgnify:CR=1 FL=1